jgi:predicted permease
LVVSSDYFKAMSIPLIQGRFFSDRDDANKPAVVIVDEILANRFFGSPADALGKRLTLNKRTQPSEIVGVVRHVKYSGVAEQSRVTVYEANGQFPVQSVYLAIQTTEDRTIAATIVRNEVLGLDKDQPITEVRSMDQIVEDSTASRKLTMFLLNTFSALALILASAGLYAVVSYTTSQRTREIAIRVALGAKYRDVLKLVVTQGMVLAVFGIGLGLVLALALTRLMAGLLFGIGTTDAATYISLSLFLILVTFTACYVPARKATRIDPMIVLRDE